MMLCSCGAIAGYGLNDEPICLGCIADQRTDYNEGEA